MSIFTDYQYSKFCETRTEKLTRSPLSLKPVSVDCMKPIEQFRVKLFTDVCYCCNQHVVCLLTFTDFQWSENVLPQMRITHTCCRLREVWTIHIWTISIFFWPPIWKFYALWGCLCFELYLYIYRHYAVSCRNKVENLGPGTKSNS